MTSLAHQTTLLCWIFSTLQFSCSVRRLLTDVPPRSSSIWPEPFPASQVRGMDPEQKSVHQWINYKKYWKKNKNILMYEYTAARRFSNYTSVNLGVVWTDKGLAPDYFGAQLLGWTGGQCLPVEHVFWTQLFGGVSNYQDRDKLKIFCMYLFPLFRQMYKSIIVKTQPNANRVNTRLG